MVPHRSHLQRVTSKEKVLGLDEPYLMTPEKLELWLKSYSNLLDNCYFLVIPSRSHPQEETSKYKTLGLCEPYLTTL